MSSPLKTCWRLLTFQASREELIGLSEPRFLYFGLLCTWLVGIGRWWDDPGAHLLQHLGLGSLIYVFVMGSVLWICMLLLRPAHWSWRRVVTFVSLTSPPAALYAIPVERFMDLAEARNANILFLLSVASWRVGLLFFFLSRLGRLSFTSIFAGGLLPLCAIVTTLSSLNLERAVFDVMGGLREPSANDGAYAVLFYLTLLAMLAVVPLLMIYIGCAYIAYKHPRENDSGTGPTRQSPH